jgi:hypothetical protein
MAINGRMNVDVLFHDTDGTTSLKVVSLEDSTEYTTGKVAIVTGTCGTAGATVFPSNTQYKDSVGNVVAFAQVSRVAFTSSRPCELLDNGEQKTIAWSAGNVSLNDYSVAAGEDYFAITPVFTSGTASYTLVLYGT